MSDATELIDEINESIEKAKAIADLMAAAAADIRIEHDNQLLWAKIVISDLLDSAYEQANKLFEAAMAKEQNNV